MVARLEAPTALIADAEPYICRVLEAKLSKDDQFRVVSATTGAAALQSAVEQTFDVLLWDMRLRDTASLLPRLRALCPRAALILMTTDDRPTLPADASRLDVADVLVKPFGLDTLVERLWLVMGAEPKPAAVAKVDLAHIGQQIAIRSPGGVCVTRVLESRQDVFAVVGAPRIETPPDFKPGQRVRVEVQGEDALYNFGSILRLFLSDPVPRWELDMPRVIRREQRRRHPRRAQHLQITLEEVNAPTPGKGKKRAAAREAPSLPVAEGVTEDVSLGGCVFASETPLPVGTTYRFALQPPAAQAVEGLGRIARRESIVQEAGRAVAAPQYRIAIHFSKLTASDRRRLRELLQSET